MKYNLLGTTGLLVSELCFGTMTFGGTGELYSHVGGQQQGEVNELLKAVVDSGINFLDTANVYSSGLAEELLGTGLRQAGLARQELVIATKVAGKMGEGVNQRGLSRYHIFDSVDASLKRLQLDHIDLLYVHGVDPALPVEQVMHSLHDLVLTGKVRYLGVCNWPSWKVAQAVCLARQHGWHEFVGMQYYYSIANRDSENDLLPLALDQNLAFLPWSPLAGGFVSGKFTRDQPKSTGGDSRRDTLDFPVVDKARGYDTIDVLLDLAKQHEVTAAEIALAWVRQQRGVTSTLIGTKTLAQLRSNVHSTTIQLTADELTALDAPSRAPKPYPGWVIDFQTADRFPKG